MPQPVTIFLRQSLTLRAEAAACLDAPKPKPVHHLRSATRRIEATLELLMADAQIAGLRKTCKPLRRSLRTIRRAAGDVRDLDVHRGLLRAYGKSSGAATLDRELLHARDLAARKLQKRLEQDHRTMQHDLDDLEAALQPALDLELPGGTISEFAKSWFDAAVRNLDVEHDQQLHSIRKAGKTARYLAEAGAGVSHEASRAEARFEAAQKTLGEWHDHLLLLERAKASLGNDHELVREIEADGLKLRQRASAAAKRLLGTSSAMRGHQASNV